MRSLLAYSALKTEAEKLGVEAVDRRAGVANIKFHREARVNPDKLMRMVGRIKGAQFTPAGVLRVPLDGLTSPIEVLEYLRERAVELMA